MQKQANDPDREEAIKHSSVFIPYSYCHGVMPDYYPCVPLHWHREFEICMILSGQCTFRRDGDIFTAKPEDIIIIPPGTMHSIHPCGGRVAYDIILFHPRIITGGNDDRIYIELLEPILSGKSVIGTPICTKNPYYNEMKDSINTIFHCSRENRAEQDLLLKSELMRFFWLLIKSGEIQLSEREKSGLSEMMYPVIEYIAEHFSEHITVEQLAKVAHLSESYFMNSFKKFLGLTATDYLNQVRIKEVCKLLLETNESVTEIAFVCGFRNIPNFNRRFKEIVDCTPLEYRRSAKNGSVI